VDNPSCSTRPGQVSLSTSIRPVTASQATAEALRQTAALRGPRLATKKNLPFPWTPSKTRWPALQLGWKVSVHCFLQYCDFVCLSASKKGCFQSRDARYGIAGLLCLCVWDFSGFVSSCILIFRILKSAILWFLGLQCYQDSFPFLFDPFRSEIELG
jgi:hypothetical protein